MTKHMKRGLLIVLAVLTILPMAACKGKDETSPVAKDELQSSYSERADDRDGSSDGETVETSQPAMSDEDAASDEASSEAEEASIAPEVPDDSGDGVVKPFATVEDFVNSSVFQESATKSVEQFESDQYELKLTANEDTLYYAFRYKNLSDLSAEQIETLNTSLGESFRAMSEGFLGIAKQLESVVAVENPKVAVVGFSADDVQLCYIEFHADGNIMSSIPTVLEG